MKTEKKNRLAIVGLGYVGLPLAVAFSKKYEVIGFDISQGRIKELNDGHDATLEVGDKELVSSLAGSGEGRLTVTRDLELIKTCNVYIITVPTPTDKHFNPDLTPLLKASETVGRCLSKDNIVIYESTVYPGATEEDCVPILQTFSKLVYNEDFFCGYSPERINPGDKEHTVTKILKVTSGSTPEIADEIDKLYSSVIEAGTFKAASIKVAEAAKVIENSQRDINIAFVNELAIIFNKLGIDTADVLEAAETKWNFLPFKPGLVGGHCIGVDPYYLAMKAQQVGYYPQMILSGRRLNNGIGSYIAKQLIKLLIHSNQNIRGARVLVLGITFKENCPDIRNSKVIDIIHELIDYEVEVETYDPWADRIEVKRDFGINLLSKHQVDFKDYNGIVLAVAHKEFLKFVKERSRGTVPLIYDVKSFLPKELASNRL